MKTILIAGSSSGIGRAIAEKVLQENNRVIGLARHRQTFAHDYYITYKIDFSKINELETHFKTISQEHAKIDALICSVGFGDFAFVEQFSVQRMQHLLNVNFLSQAILIKTFLPKFKRQGYGKIILIGSECALEGQKQGAMYCASKFALRGFAQSLRKECVANNVAVTLINPGFVATPFFEALEFAPAEGEEFSIQAEQIASLISTIMNEKNNCVYEEINLQPMKKAIKKIKV